MEYNFKSGQQSPANAFSQTQKFARGALNKSRNLQEEEAKLSQTMLSAAKRPKKVMAIFNTQLNSRMRQGSQPRARPQSAVKPFQIESKDELRNWISDVGSEQLRIRFGNFIHSLPAAPRLQMTYKVV